MTTSLLRGVRSASKFAPSVARPSHPSRSQDVLLDPTFRYHVPRRIPTRAFSSPTSAYLQPTKATPEVSQQNATEEPNPYLTSNDDVHEIGQGTELDHTPISLYLSSVGSHAKYRAGTKTATPSTLSQVARRAFHTTSPTRKSLRDVENAVRQKAHEQPAAAKTPDHAKSYQEQQQAAANTPEHEKSYQEQLYDRIHMPQFHRPTKEELLATATGFWSRLKVRFKWATIKSVRPYNMDEIMAFFSWVIFGHIVWLIVGTTTFVSLAILAINTVFAQETLAGWIGNSLTKSSGLKVVFESAVVPKWSDGVITFKNVFITRRPGGETKSSVKKGSPEEAAIAAGAEIPPEDQNYTQFEINIGEVNVSLSFNKWWNSKGFLKNVEIKHVRGVVDRTHVFWTEELANMDPKSYRHHHNPGDFEIEAFKIDDLLVTVHQPKNFRPFTVSIYNADLPRLRQQWLFYDFLSANSMTGEFDNSLFTIHQRQTHSYTGADLTDPDEMHNDPWKKQSRIRVDALNIDHLNRGVEGAFSWIHEGNVDIVADVMIPNDSDDSVTKLMSDFYDRMEATLTSMKHRAQVQAEEDAEDTPPTPSQEAANEAASSIDGASNRFMVMDLRIHLNDVRASVPIFTRDLSYVNNALIRPIVAYINSRRTFIPINCRVVKRASDFDGSWTIFDSSLMDDLSAEVYDAFARDVTDDQARMRRIKKVGLWGVQLAVQAIFLVSSFPLLFLMATTDIVYRAWPAVSLDIHDRHDVCT